MPNTDADELRQLASTALEKKATDTKLALQREHEMANQDGQIAKLLQACLDGATKGLLSVETARFSQDVAQRLAAHGLSIATVSWSGKTFPAPSPECEMAGTEFRWAIDEFQPDFRAYLEGSGQSKLDVHRQLDAGSRLSSINFGPSFSALAALATETANRHLASIWNDLHLVEDRLEGIGAETETVNSHPASIWNDLHLLKDRLEGIETELEDAITTRIYPWEDKASLLTKLRLVLETLNREYADCLSLTFPVAEMRAKLGAIHRAEKLHWQSLIRKQYRSARAEKEPVGMARIDWYWADQIEPGNLPTSNFADMLRFISGPQWNEMYVDIKHATKHAAKTGEVNYQIEFSIASDQSLELTVGTHKKFIPCISPTEFCKVLQERSGMKCEVLKSAKRKSGTIQLAW